MADKAQVFDNTDRKKALSELSSILGFEARVDDLFFLLSGSISIDIRWLDREYSKRDSEYEYEACLYKGNKISMKNYTRIRYGDRAVELIELLMK